jgi:hypothetical protein
LKKLLNFDEVFSSIRFKIYFKEFLLSKKVKYPNQPENIDLLEHIEDYKQLTQLKRVEKLKYIKKNYLLNEKVSNKLKNY